ncbi:putative Tic20 family protein [Arcicella rosea]|uniref:Putative Tic20 family protein n=1 Tax=Arcicella rosea TaxID=502909 RepID=A0A841ESM6_9BACT|nr:putative Tic20 family protein [Arcicella rosea]
MKGYYKIPTIIFSLLLIIPGDKISFPVFLIILLSFTGGFLQILFSLFSITSIIYLIYSTYSKFNNKADSIVTITIILISFLLLLTQYNTLYYYGDIAVFISIFLFLAFSILTLYYSINKLINRGK